MLTYNVRIRCIVGSVKVYCWKCEDYRSSSVQYRGDTYVHVLMRDDKEERNKQGQTNNKAKQHSTPKSVTFPRKMSMYMQIHVHSTLAF